MLNNTPNKNIFPKLGLRWWTNSNPKTGKTRAISHRL